MGEGILVDRRSVIKAGAGAALMAAIGELAWRPDRAALAATTPSNIQFNIGAFIAPARQINGVNVQFGPVFVLFVPLRLNRTPTRNDQNVLNGALATIESRYAFSPAGIIVHTAYGLPYFNRLPQSTIVAPNMPRLLSNTNRFALEEAVPSPTDVSPVNPGITKLRFNVPVRIENNDLVLMLRSDSTDRISDVLAWLQGSNRLAGATVTSPAFNGLFSFQTTRLQFTQIGMPRLIASHFSPPYLDQINDASPMWMGFTDQQVDASAAANEVVFQGGGRLPRFTTATSSSYFADSAIMHLSHVIEDLAQFYNRDPNAGAVEDFLERVQYMFRSNQLGTTHGVPSEGTADGFADGGGPATLANVFQGNDAALRGARASGGVFQPGNQTLDATFNGEHRIGHEAALQRFGRNSAGVPFHIRMDGPGFDAMDVPGGANREKLQFAVFMPTAEQFRQMRVGVAAQDLQAQFLGGDDEDNGLERFITATRRQNFLIPSRAHRAFPLRELFA